MKDYASEKLEDFKKKNPVSMDGRAKEGVIYFTHFQNPTTMTTSFGAPMPTRTAVMTAGPRGPLLMQDVLYLDEMAHFDRERIPERVVGFKFQGL